MGYNSADQGWGEEYGAGNDFEDFLSLDSDPDGDGDYDPSYDNVTFDDSMDGDAESAFESCGWGVDESYEHYDHEQDDMIGQDW